MNYATLVQTIKAYTENDFPLAGGSGGLPSADQLATFIRQAEQRIYNSAQLLVERSNRTGNMTMTNPYLTAPTDWMATFSMAIKEPTTGEYIFLLNKDVNFIREAFPSPQDVGRPTHYALFDENTFLIGPTPDFNYFVEIHYFRYPESITTSLTGTTWLGDNFDSALLYGSLLEAYTFMKGEEDVMKTYQARYGEALAMVKQFAEGKNRQDMYRTEQVRYPVQ